jgi:hypothetical protein
LARTENWRQVPLLNVNDLTLAINWANYPTLYLPSHTSLDASESRIILTPHWKSITNHISSRGGMCKEEPRCRVKTNKVPDTLTPLRGRGSAAARRRSVSTDCFRCVFPLPPSLSRIAMLHPMEIVAHERGKWNLPLGILGGAAAADFMLLGAAAEIGVT